MKRLIKTEPINSWQRTIGDGGNTKRVSAGTKGRRKLKDKMINNEGEKLMPVMEER